MHWYGGSIAEAVALSKQKNAIFVVFVEGDNDLSAEMRTVLNDPAVMKRLADSTNFLAITLKSGSTDYTHFAQIYQFVPVPSLFFIGRNGTPLEVVCAGVQAGNLASRIDRIIEEHHKNKPAAAQPSTSNKDIKEQTVNLLSSESSPGGSKAPIPAPVETVAAFAEKEAGGRILNEAKIKSESSPGGSKAPIPAPVETVAALAEKEAESSGPAAKVPKLDDQTEVTCNDGVCVRRPRADGAGPSKSPDTVTQQEPESATMESTESSLSAEEKMERAKALIEAKRREKAEKEKQLEKEKEKERRNLGQGVAELKRWQADQELKQIQEERKREKMENNLARQRILEQIAQDRAERRARDAPPEPTPQPQQQQQQTAPAARDKLQEQLMLARAERRAKENAKLAVSQPEPAQTDKPTGPLIEQSTEPILASSGDASAHARIQFKLPDGTSHTAHFAADGTLAAVQQYVADNLNLPTSQFALWSAFPRRELVESDATLRRLELAPSAALLVLPRRQPTAVTRPTPVGGVIAFISQLLSSIIVSPSHRLYAWLMSLVSRAPPPGPPSTPAAPSASAGGVSPTGLRRRGNVHRLQGETPDDDNNTWNGNSTQQM